MVDLVESPERAQRRALVADDDVTNLRMLAMLVRSWGFEPITATDGVHALEVLRGPSRPDVAILDWMMPGLSGPDVCRALALPAAQRPHLVLLTARGENADLVEALGAGADDYVTKPFDHRVLRARVEAGMRRAAARDAGELVPGVVVDGRYRLEAPIGVGGMGAVWRATHLGLGSTVALKVLRCGGPELPFVRERFEREAKVLAAISSPHVVRVLDYGASEPPYLVMEHLVGPTLDERLVRSGPLSLDEARTLATELGAGLDAAHDAGVLHRDVKPANVMCSHTRDGVVAKLIDFGIATPNESEVGPSLTRHGQVLGTLGFMSPAQLLGEPSTRECDLWSLGATLVAALVGRSPFDAEIPALTVRATLEGPLRLPTSLRHDLPHGLDLWAEVAFARDRSLGFGSAGELAYAFVDASRR